MIINFNPEQCGDARVYLEMGELCARTGSCWSPLRPIGIAEYFSIPFRLGIEPRFIILFNMGLVILSAIITADVIRRVFRFSSPSSGLLCGLAASAAAHYVFLWGNVWTSMSDLPAACFALIGLWAMLRSALKGEILTGMVGGLLLGLSVITRAFYIYCAIAAGAAFVITAWRGRVSARWGLAAACAVMAVPILIQFATTYHHTQRWSLVEEDAGRALIKLHLTVPYSGSDTIAGAGATYVANDCLKEPGTYVTQLQISKIGTLDQALRRGDFAGVACVLLRKQKFYFESYASRTYLGEAAERFFSPAVVMLHLLVLVSLARSIFLSKFKRVFLAPMVFAAAVWASGSVLLPETRFMLVFYVLAWSLGLGGLLSTVTASWKS